jgi:hypothetical protein
MKSNILIIVVSGLVVGALYAFAAGFIVSKCDGGYNNGYMDGYNAAKTETGFLPYAKDTLDEG